LATANTGRLRKEGVIENRVTLLRNGGNPIRTYIKPIIRKIVNEISRGSAFFVLKK